MKKRYKRNQLNLKKKEQELLGNKKRRIKGLDNKLNKIFKN